MKKIAYFYIFFFALNISANTDSLLNQAKQLFATAYEAIVGPSVAKKIDAIKSRYLKNQKIEPFTQKRKSYELLALFYTMRNPIDKLCINRSKKITSYIECSRYIQDYTFSPKGREKIKTLGGQNELLAAFKKLYLKDLMFYVNNDIEFWHHVLNAMDKKQDIYDTLFYVKEILEKNNPVEVERLLNMAIKSADAFYVNKPHIKLFITDEMFSLKFLLDRYSKNPQKQILLEDIKVGQPWWRQGSDDAYSNWTNSRYFWFVILHDMGNTSVTLNNTWATLEDILKKNNRKTVYTLLDTAMKKIYSLEKISAYASPAAWWESIKTIYSDTFN